ncbi:MAG: cation:proton antiporter [Pontiellaceae bacterium]|jgi:Kef-type K+ transport system membrane component KefB|nr:cation:proton antiporter [Pontiellaceae bacterium]
MNPSAHAAETATVIAQTVQQTASANSHTELMTLLVLQLAFIIICARLGGFLFQRFLKLPSVLGELVAGMIIGPYALGAKLPLPGIGPLFATQTIGLPVSSELYAIATIASIILLFLSGLATDLRVFMRYSVIGFLVGLGGLLVSFVLGDFCAIWFGMAPSFMDPAALFLGTISTATSVGITARILTEKHKMSSPEGVTILAGAVIDDVLGIIVLAVVVGMTKVIHAGGTMNWGHVGIVALKALGFWIICTALGLLLARQLTGVLKRFGSPEVIVSISLGLALMLAGVSEMAGLAMIIGAYIMGLSLSRTDVVQELQNSLQGVYDMFVPVFFCVMGMMVDFSAMRKALLFGLVYSLLAIFAKIAGCGIPAYLTKFNFRGALRIGLGMLPRGEVALIVAGIGLSTQCIGQDLFGVAILMTMITTLMAPPLLVKSFHGPAGLRHSVPEAEEKEEVFSVEFASPDIADFLMQRLVRAFQHEEFFVNRLQMEAESYQVRKDDISFTLSREGGQIHVSVPPDQQHIARFMIYEELLSLSDLLEASKNMKSLNAMGSELIGNLF